MSYRYLSTERITNLTASVGLTLPANASSANRILVDVEAANVRYKGDADDPTSTDGGLMLALGQYEYIGDLGKLRFIEAGGGAAITVTYFKQVAG